MERRRGPVVVLLVDPHVAPTSPLSGGDRERGASIESSRRVPRLNAADTELVTRMARGDRSALGELYQRFAPRLLSLICAIVRDARLAEDLLHDVFIEAWRA